MVTHQRVACSWNARPDMAGSPHLPEDRASSPPSPNIETTFTLSSLSFHRGKLQFEVYCNHLIVWSYSGFIKKVIVMMTIMKMRGPVVYNCFLPLKFSHYPSRPVPVSELFGKYPTRPVPKSKTPTRQTLLTSLCYCTRNILRKSNLDKLLSQPVGCWAPAITNAWRGSLRKQVFKLRLLL